MHIVNGTPEYDIGDVFVNTHAIRNVLPDPAVFKDDILILIDYDYEQCALEKTMVLLFHGGIVYSRLNQQPHNPDHKFWLRYINA